MPGKRARQFFINTWSGIAIIGILFFLHYTQIAKPIENLITRIIQPVQAQLYTGVQDLVNKSEREEELQQLSKEALIKSHLELEDQIKTLVSENTRLQTIVQDAKLLEEQVAFLQEQSYQSVQARVVSKTSEGVAQRIILNRGYNHGIQNGLPVISEEGIVVGTVHETNDYSCEVLLLTSYDSHLSAVVQNEHKSPGIISGEHNLSLQMDYIPQSDTVLVQDVVMTSGADSLIPEGLLVGQVQEVISQPGQLFQYAKIVPFMEINNLKLVSIILP